MTTLAPKAREDLEYIERVIDDEEVVLVRDPVRGMYFKYNALQAAMLQALDGTRTPPEITAVLAEQYEVDIPPEAAERFIARVRDNYLLEITAYAKTPPTAAKSVRKALDKAGFQRRSLELREPVSAETRKFAEAFKHLDEDHPRAAAVVLSQILAANPNNARARQLRDLVQNAYIKAAGGGTEFPTLVLFNPLKLLQWLSRTIGNFLFAWTGVLALVALVIAGVYAYTLVSLEHLEFGAFDIAVGILIYLAATLFHEIGHGLACQHYGGHVTEIGFMFMYYVTPAAYCDTSSSYTITNRLHKVMIQLGGTVATVTWLAFHAILLAVLSPTVAIYPGLLLALLLIVSVMFLTLIPFLKFDGYYVIADYYNIPNMRERSFKLAHAWFAKKLFGLETQTEQMPDRQRRYLIVYATVSFLFTVAFMYTALFKLAVPLVEHYKLGGLAVAVFLIGYTLRNLTIKPAWRGIKTLVRERKRVFTAKRSLALAGALAVLIVPWCIPWPVLIDAPLEVVPLARADVRAQTPGRLVEILVQEGARVTKGQPVARLSNPELRARIAALEAERDVVAFQLRQIKTGARPEELALARRRVERARTETSQQARTAQVAQRLAVAKAGTASAADAAMGNVAGAAGEARAASWLLQMLEAGARPEDIAIYEAEAERVEAELARLRQDAELLVLRAPIDGVVTTPHVHERLQEALAVGDRFVEIHDTRQVIAEIALPESEPLGTFRPGSEVEARLVGMPGHPVRVTIDHVREVAQVKGAKHKVVVVTKAFTVPDGAAGMTGHARIYGDRHSLAYAHIYLPLRRLVSVRLWSM